MQVLVLARLLINNIGTVAPFDIYTHVLALAQWPLFINIHVLPLAQWPFLINIHVLTLAQSLFLPVD